MSDATRRCRSNNDYTHNVQDAAAPSSSQGQGRWEAAPMPKFTDSFYRRRYRVHSIGIFQHSKRHEAFPSNHTTSPLPSPDARSGAVLFQHWVCTMFHARLRRHPEHNLGFVATHDPRRKEGCLSSHRNLQTKRRRAPLKQERAIPSAIKARYQNWVIPTWHLGSPTWQFQKSGTAAEARHEYTLCFLCHAVEKARGFKALTGAY